MRALAPVAVIFVLFSGVAHAQIGRVAGTITDEDGRPVKGATIVADNREQAPATFTSSSDSKGRFSILGMKRGTWTFTIQAPGFEVASTRLDVVTVRPNPPLNVRLEKTPEPSRPGPLTGVDARAIQGKIDAAESRAASGDLTGAISAYREILSGVPSLTSIYLRIGALHEARHEPSSALAEYRRLAELEPGNAAAQSAISRLNKQ
ncbi:MAG: carboxypeptidase regulatory-like domain-containing protein [Vicinamibacterales bacterium]